MTPRISAEQRLEWLSAMPSFEVPPEFIAAILETKPPTVDTLNGAQYLAVCKLHDEGRIIIRGFVNGNIGETSKRTFTLSYPDPEARTQTNLFDL